MRVATSAAERVQRVTLLATICACVAVALWIAGVAVAVHAFDSANGVRYSWTNHVASELGFPFASRMTWTFNAAMLMIGLLALPTMGALRMRLDTKLADAAAWAGAGSCLAVANMGLFGLVQDVSGSDYIFMHYFAVHASLAALFAIGWWVTITLFGLEFIRRWSNAAGRRMACFTGACWLVYPLFLASVIRSNPTQAALLSDLKSPAFRAAVSIPSSAPMLSPWLDLHRPPVWGQAAMEWIWIYSVMLWLGMALLFLWRTRPLTMDEGQKSDRK